MKVRTLMNILERYDVDREVVIEAIIVDSQGAEMIRYEVIDAKTDGNDRLILRTYQEDEDVAVG